MEVIIEGVLSVQAGENSRIIKEKINSILENDKETDKVAESVQAKKFNVENKESKCYNQANSGILTEFACFNKKEIIGEISINAYTDDINKKRNDRKIHKIIVKYISQKLTNLSYRRFYYGGQRS